MEVARRWMRIRQVGLRLARCRKRRMGQRPGATVQWPWLTERRLVCEAGRGSQTRWMTMPGLVIPVLCGVVCVEREEGWAGDIGRAEEIGREGEGGGKGKGDSERG